MVLNNHGLTMSILSVNLQITIPPTNSILRKNT